MGAVSRMAATTSAGAATRTCSPSGLPPTRSVASLVFGNSPSPNFRMPCKLWGCGFCWSDGTTLTCAAPERTAPPLLCCCRSHPALPAGEQTRRGAMRQAAQVARPGSSYQIVGSNSGRQPCHTLVTDRAAKAQRYQRSLTACECVAERRRCVVSNRVPQEIQVPQLGLASPQSQRCPRAHTKQRPTFPFASI